MSTASQVDLYFTYRVKDGEQARFEQYLDLVPPVTEEKEPYVLEYEIFRQTDGSYLQHERYADLCRARHKSAYAEVRVMPTPMLDSLVSGWFAVSGAA